MIVLYLILLAVIQAVTEFLPVSSLGHLGVMEHFLGMEQDTGLLIESMLHLGTAAAIIFLYRNELKRLLLEAVGMLMDAIGNLNLYIHNRRTGNRLKYARIVTGSYRKFAALLLVSMIPTALLGISSRRLAVVAGASPICQGIGFLISGIILLVTYLNNSGGEKGPREASWDSAMWIGICQGLSVFPGISRLGLTVCAALLCGYSRKFALLFSIFYEFTGCDRGVLYGNRIFWCAQYDSWNDFCQHFCNAPGGGGRMSGDSFYGSACAENKVSVFCSLFVCHWCDRFTV